MKNPSLFEDNRSDLAVWLVVLASVVIFLEWLLLPVDVVFQVNHEGNWVESITLLNYMVALAFALLFKTRGDSRVLQLCIGWMILFFAAREADLHKVFDGDSLLKLSFYASQHTWAEKLMGASVLLATVLSMAVLVLNRKKLFDWRHRRSHQFTFMVFVVVFVASKILDRSVNILNEDYNIQLGDAINALILAYEEGLELTLPILIGMGLYQRSQPRHGF